LHRSWSGRNGVRDRHGAGVLDVLLRRADDDVVDTSLASSSDEPLTSLALDPWCRDLTLDINGRVGV
jgi:hypothetical protein